MSPDWGYFITYCHVLKQVTACLSQFVLCKGANVHLGPTSISSSAPLLSHTARWPEGRPEDPPAFFSCDSAICREPSLTCRRAASQTWTPALCGGHLLTGWCVSPAALNAGADGSAVPYSGNSLSQCVCAGSLHHKMPRNLLTPTAEVTHSQ